MKNYDVKKFQEKVLIEINKYNIDYTETVLKIRIMYSTNMDTLVCGLDYGIIFQMRTGASILVIFHEDEQYCIDCFAIQLGNIYKKKIIQNVPL